MIYKIFRGPEWDELQKAGATEGAPVDLADGFIHFSTAAQVRETAAKHFSGEDRLVLAAVDEAVLAPDLKWEPSRGGALFPHLYRKLAKREVAAAYRLNLQNGAHVFPEGLA